MKCKSTCHEDFKKLWCDTVGTLLGPGSTATALGYVEVSAAAGEEAKAGDTIDFEIIAVYPSVEARTLNDGVVSAALASGKDMLAAAPERHVHPEAHIYAGHDGIAITSEITFDKAESVEAWVAHNQTGSFSEAFGDSLYCRVNPEDPLKAQWFTLTNDANWKAINDANMRSMEKPAMTEFFASMTKMDIAVVGNLSAGGLEAMMKWDMDPRITITFPEPTVAYLRYSATAETNAFVNLGKVTCESAEQAVVYANLAKTVGNRYKNNGVFVIYPLSDTTFQWIEVSNKATWLAENTALGSFEGMGKFIGAIQDFSGVVAGDIDAEMQTALKQWTSQAWCNIKVNPASVVQSARY